MVKDKDDRVRQAALKLLNGAPVPQLEKELRSEVEVAEFTTRSDAEMRLLAECYGRAGGKRAVAALHRLAFRNRLRMISSAGRPDVRAALWGLWATGDDQAKLDVRRAAKSWLPGLKAAAQEVMKEVEGTRG